MAEQQEDRSSDDLTEEASTFRLEEFRRQGKVAQSRELASVVALLATFTVCILITPKTGSNLIEFMQEMLTIDRGLKLDFGSNSILRTILEHALKTFIWLSLPICGAGFLLGILGSLLQFGGVFSFDPLHLDFEKINPIQGLSRLFSKKHFFESLRMIFKSIVIFLVSFFLIQTVILKAPLRFYGDPLLLLNDFGQVGKYVFIILIFILSIFAGIDFGIQKYEYLKSLRMTKTEAKSEHREKEGDPQIKARVRTIQREISKRRMMQAVKKSDVIITNPTHIAVALVYEKNTMSAPKVVAKGADLIAQKIKKIATETGIPLVENVPLARTLFKTVKLGQTVPQALYQAVAEVLAYVYRLKNKKV